MICSSGAPRRLLLVVLATVGIAEGCGQQPLQMAVPIRGVVNLDGQPLSSGVVQFQPATGQTATGEIGHDGGFTLSRNAPGDGVLPGTYRVTVVSYDPTAETQAIENLRVPLKYTRFGSSGIEFTVFPGTKDPFVIDLVSDGEGAVNLVRPADAPAPGDGSVNNDDRRGESDGATESPTRGSE